MTPEERRLLDLSLKALEVGAKSALVWLYQNGGMTRSEALEAGLTESELGETEVVGALLSTEVDLGLGERSQSGEAQTGQCPPGFEKYCVLESGEACPHYHDGRCALEEELVR